MQVNSHKHQFSLILIHQFVYEQVTPIIREHICIALSPLHTSVCVLESLQFDEAIIEAQLKWRYQLACLSSLHIRMSVRVSDPLIGSLAACFSLTLSTASWLISQTIKLSLEKMIVHCISGFHGR